MVTKLTCSASLLAAVALLVQGCSDSSSHSAPAVPPTVEARAIDGSNNNQTTTFKSCKSGTKTSDGNLTGCCSTTGNASLDFGCPGLNDSAKVTMRVNATQSNACTAYTLDYHY